MAPLFPCANAELDYPLYAVDFDPEDASRVAVSGGGGPGRSGVGNKITILDAGAPDQLRVAGELDLPRDEDSVMSLAFGAHKGRTAYLYAGVNSSPVSILKGKNEHLRTIGVEQSRARQSAGTKTPGVKVAELSRAALFSKADPEAFQRVLRVSGSLGVAATCLGQEAELAVFDVTGPTPKPRGVLELSHDAEDVDIVQTGEDQYQIAFCYKYELYVVEVGAETSDARLVYTMPEENSEQPKFRSIRYLSPNFILAVSNLPGGGGAILQGIRLPKADNPQGRLAVTARIPRKMMATALSVAVLTPPASPETPLGDSQIVIAVGGSDSSISLYTLEHQTSAALSLLIKLYPLHTFKDVHGSENVTGVSFSRFITPKTHIRPQSIKLASISLRQTVAVHTIPLTKFIDKMPRNRKGPPRPVRYVVAAKSQAPSPRPVIITLSIFLLIMAIAGQAIIEMYGNGKPFLVPKRYLPSWHSSLRDPNHQPAYFLADEFLSKLSGGRERVAGETLVVWEDDKPSATDDAVAEPKGGDPPSKDLRLDVHDVEVHGPGMAWDELETEQKQAWKDRLQQAGAWAENMGESVFKGILFGELAGVVAAAVE